MTIERDLSNTESRTPQTEQGHPGNSQDCLMSHLLGVPLKVKLASKFISGFKAVVIELTRLKMTTKGRANPSDNSVPDS